MITWKTISQLGNNKIVNRSYIYLFLVPILAKLLSKINSPLIFILGTNEHEVVLELPFSWSMFFFSALFFTFGTIIYNLIAPSIIKENKSFGSFLVDKKDSSHILKYAEDLYLDTSLGELSDYGSDTDENMKRAFWYVYNRALVYRKSLIWVAFMNYILGLILIIIVFLQGFMKVLQLSSPLKFNEMFCTFCN